MVKFFANGQPLTEVGVIQNGVGIYYYNPYSGLYDTPVLRDFATYKPQLPYRKYTDGSHGRYYKPCNGCWAYQKAIDFAIPSDVVITADQDITVIYRGYDSGSWCRVKYGQRYFRFVHTYNWAGGTVKAGQPICTIAPSSVTGFGSHLHLFLEGGDIQDYLLKGATMSYAKDTWVQTTTDVFVRVNYDTSADGVIMKKGTKMQVKTTAKYNDGYTWQYVKGITPTAHGVTEGWVAMEFVQATNAPEKPCVNNHKQIKKLATEIDKDAKKVYDLMKHIEKQTEQIKKLSV